MEEPAVTRLLNLAADDFAHGYRSLEAALGSSEHDDRSGDISNAMDAAKEALRHLNRAPDVWKDESHIRWTRSSP